MDWEKAATYDGTHEKLEDGYHQVKVVSVYRQTKDGVPYESASGPYMYVGFANLRGAQASASFWLTEKAGWKLAKALKAMGLNMKKMTEAGIEIGHFLDQDFCTKQLVGRDCWVLVERDGKYANAEVIDSKDIPVNVRNANPAPPDESGGGASMPPDEDIPFSPNVL